MTKYNQSFREQAIQKALQKGSRSLKTIASDLSVGYSTLHRWIRESHRGLTVNNMKTNKRPKDWSGPEKFQVLLETHTLDTRQINQYCREHGIYPHQLEDWKQTFLQSGGKGKGVDPEIKSLKDKVKVLTKELGRKEKALAETAALLVLQKKFQALLEDKE